MAAHAHPATVTQTARGYVVTVYGVRLRGQEIRGEGVNRDAAIVDAKRRLARFLNVGTHDVSLIIEGQGGH